MTDLRERLQASLGTTYTLERELGGGGMSRVFVATEAALRRRVVVKVLSPELAQGFSAERFAREIQLAAALQEPHIVPVLAAGESDGIPYYTMPYVEGESLRARLLRGEPVPLNEAVGILRDVALALDYAHRHGVVHRDIKPENVLLSGRTAVVADFGIAKALLAAGTGRQERPERGSARDLRTLTQLGVSLGTPAYMAPEQVAGDAVDHRADLYAWGVVAYELLAGRHPFADKPTTQALMSAHLVETPASLLDRRPGLPPPLAGLVMRALEKSPDARPQSAVEVLQGLDGLTTPGSTSEALGGTHPTGRARAGRWRPAMTLAVSAVVIALGAGGVFAWRRTSAEAAEAGPKRIAVLPFENQGAAEDEYFADGITDEIRGKLGAIPGLEVIARGSSTPYKNSSETPQEIAKELGVRYLLTAVVRWEKRADGQSIVHVTPELVEVDGDAAPSSRWQDRFDQPLTNVFQVQADIAGRVAAALDVALGAPARTQLAERPTANLEAYDAYLKGVAGLDAATSSAAALRRTVDQFERAVALDSTFAGAWAQLARSLVLLYANGLPSPAVKQRARVAAERLAALSPNSAQTHAALASVLRVEGETEAATREYDLALAAAPNDPDVLRAVASGRRTAGQLEESLAMLQRAEALDPRSAQVVSALMLVQLYLRHPANVLATAARARLLAPTSLDLLEDEVVAHLQRGDLDAARRTLARASNLDQPSLVAYFSLYWDLYWVLDETQQHLALRLPPSAYDDDEAASAVVRAEVYALRGDPKRKRAYGDTAEMKFAAQLRETPDDAQRHAVRGLALAYAGRKEEALQEAERAAELLPASKDVFTYAYLLHQRVRIYMEVGETERALDGLEEMLAQPYFVTREWLRIDPNFAPLRGNPRFERLAAGHLPG